MDRIVFSKKNGFTDFGPEMTKQFYILFDSFFVGNKLIIEESFINESFKLFEKFNLENKQPLSDSYFNNLTNISEFLLRSGRHSEAFIYWRKILNFVNNWEKNNLEQKLHKGTPYYFSAIAATLNNDFDAAIMSMCNALQEDKVNNPDWRNTPAYAFLILNDQKEDQYFKPYIDRAVSFLRMRLDGKGYSKQVYKDHYTAKINKSFDIAQFRIKFLENQSITEEIRFSFVYVLLRLWYLRTLHKNKVGDSLFAPIIFSNSLFILLLVIDNLLQKFNGANNGKQFFSKGLSILARHEGWDDSGKDYIDELDINKRKDGDFGIWCKELLDLNYKTKSGRILNRIESDFALAYGLRNFSAHTLESQHILWENYTKILQSLFNCLFKTVESVFPYN